MSNSPITSNFAVLVVHRSKFLSGFARVQCFLQKRMQSIGNPLRHKRFTVRMKYMLFPSYIITIYQKFSYNSHTTVFKSIPLRINHSNSCLVLITIIQQPSTFQRRLEKHLKLWPRLMSHLQLVGNPIVIRLFGKAFGGRHSIRFRCFRIAQGVCQIAICSFTRMRISFSRVSFVDGQSSGLRIRFDASSRGFRFGKAYF